MNNQNITTLLHEEYFKDVEVTDGAIVTPKEETKFGCEYKKFCPDGIRKYSMKCNFNHKHCIINKFYSKYDGYEQMFIGSLK